VNEKIKLKTWKKKKYWGMKEGNGFGRKAIRA
jgi:hypothetical protein